MRQPTVQPGVPGRSSCAASVGAGEEPGSASETDAARRALQRESRICAGPFSRRRFLHGVRRDEPVCRLTELHQAAGSGRTSFGELVHAPRRFDDLTHIEALGKICVQRMNVVQTGLRQVVNPVSASAVPGRYSSGEGRHVPVAYEGQRAEPESAADRDRGTAAGRIGRTSVGAGIRCRRRNNAPRGAIGRSGRGGAKMRHSWTLVGCDEGQEMYGVDAAVRWRWSTRGEPSRGGPAVRHRPSHGDRDAELLRGDTAGRSRSALASCGFTGIVDAILEADTDPDVKQRHHGASDLRAAAGRARVQRRLFHREGHVRSRGNRRARPSKHTASPAGPAQVASGCDP